MLPAQPPSSFLSGQGFPDSLSMGKEGRAKVATGDLEHQTLGWIKWCYLAQNGQAPASEPQLKDSVSTGKRGVSGHLWLPYELDPSPGGLGCVQKSAWPWALFSRPCTWDSALPSVK